MKTTPRTPTKVQLVSPKRTAQNIHVTLIKNSNTKQQYRNYKLISFEQLFKDAKELLKLKQAVDKIYNSDGVLIKSLKDIEDKSILYVSCGEEFSQNKQTPKKPQLNDENDAEEANSVPFSPFASFLKMRKEKEEQELAEQKKNEEKEKKVSKEVTSDIQNLTEEQKFIAICSIYATVDPKERGKLPGYQHILNFYNNYKLKLMTEHIGYSKIYSHILNKDLSKQLCEMSIKLTTDTKLEKIQYVITGPQNAGKTSLLCETGINLFKKIMISDKEDKVLFVPLNFQFIDFTNPIHMYQEISKNVLKSISYCCVQMTPFMKELEKAFDDVLKDPGVPNLPNCLTSVPNLSAAKLTKALKSVYKAYHERTGLSEFVKEVIYFPFNIADAFNQTLLLIIDNLSYCNIQLSNIKAFPDSVATVYVDQLMREMLSQVSYVAANRDAFQMETTEVSMEKLVEFSDIKTISCLNPVLTLSIADCNGYPGFVDQYLQIVKDLEYMINNKVESNYSKILSAVEKSRMIVIKSKISKLLINIDPYKYTDYLSNVEDVKTLVFELV